MSGSCDGLLRIAIGFTLIARLYYANRIVLFPEINVPPGPRVNRALELGNSDRRRVWLWAVGTFWRLNG
eukprot:3373922-Prymnesium_polylepis.1